MKILVVDDSTIVLKAIEKELSDPKFELTKVSDSVEALGLIYTGEFDLVTLDINMPEIDGYEFCKTIRESKDKKVSQVPIIFVTADDTLEGRIKGFEAGGTDFITKSFAKGELSSLIKSILNPEAIYKSCNVLIVDDSDLVRQVVKKSLLDLGVNVFEASDGNEAYNFLKKHLEEIDLIITDHDMPIMDGRELCTKARTELGLIETPILFLTAESDDEKKIQMFKAGASDYLKKPFLKEEFLARVEVQLKNILNVQRIRSLNKELQTTNTALNSFASAASHDIRSPLGSITQVLDLLQEDFSELLPDNAKELLSIASDSADRLIQLLECLLEHSRTTSKEIKPKPVKLKDIIDSILVDLRVQIEEAKAKVSFDELPTLMCDETLIRQLFQNLIGNSLKYQPKNQQAEVRVSYIDNGSQFEISVEDNGIGFSQKKAESLFEPFKREVSDEMYEGHGIGLATCRSIVDRHNGSIRASSSEGAGATFTVALPKAQS